MRGMICAVLLLAGCGVVADQRASDARLGLNSLELGMSRAQVVQIMGEPFKREAYNGVEFLFYRTERNPDGSWGGPRSETPVAIVGGKLDGWGRNYYDRVVRADVTVRQR